MASSTMQLTEQGPMLVGVLWMEVIICFIILCLRVYTRTIIRSNMGFDDLLLIVTWVLMVGFTALCTVAAHHGMGVHMSNLTMDEAALGKLFLLAGQTVESVAMGTSKWAVAAFLMRIVVQPWHRWFLLFWISTIMGLSVFMAISVFTQCTPTQSIWDVRVPMQKCPLNLATISYVFCSWSATLDFVLAIFPWTALWKMNMKQKEKITICASLSLGVLAGICGIIRTTGLDALNSSEDYLYDTTQSAIWTNSELTVSMICVTVPALRPLYRYVRGKHSTNEASDYNNLTPHYNKSSHARSGARNEFGLDTLTETTIQGKSSPGQNDSGSEEHIIHQVTEVTVSYEDQDETRAPSERGGHDQFPTAPVRARQHL